MSDKKMYDDIENRVRKQVNSREQEKRLLHDRTIGGENVPRPSQDFIDRNAGKPLGEKELGKEVERQTQKELRQELIAQDRATEFQKSVEQHNASLDRGNCRATGDNDEKQQMRDAMKAKLQQDRQRDRGRKR